MKGLDARFAFIWSGIMASLMLGLIALVPGVFAIPFGISRLSGFLFMGALISAANRGESDIYSQPGRSFAVIQIVSLMVGVGIYILR